MEFRDMITGIVIVGLIIVLLVTFGIKIDYENNANVSLANEPVVTSVTGNLSQYLNNSEQQGINQTQALMKEAGQSPILTVLGFYFTSILSALSLFTKGIILLIGFIFIWPTIVLGVDPIVATTISSLVIVSAILLYWSVARAGR